MRISSGYLRRFFMLYPASRSSSRLLLSFFSRRLFLALGKRTFQRKLQLFNCWLRKDRTVVTEQVIRMNFVPIHQFNSMKIPRTELQVAVSMIRNFNQHRGAIDL